jgi:hypothetical protein
MIIRPQTLTHGFPIWLIGESPNGRVKGGGERMRGWLER